MPTVRVKEGENPEYALRRFKRSCEKAGLLTICIIIVHDAIGK